MRQKSLLSSLALSTVGIGITSYLLKDKSNRQKVKSLIESAKTKIPYLTSMQTNESFPVEKAGNPSPKDIEDNRMVSEGSQFPVQYYDEKEK